VRVVIACGAAVGCLTACGGAAPAAPTAVPSVASLSAPADATHLLQTAWQSYARTFIAAEGRVVDPMSDGHTTSEGQSYALLRAAWMDDRATFDLVWRWTEQHLWLPSNRFAYLWSDGAVQDGNSAADADQDIALALLFAAHEWRDSSYATLATRTLQSIWDNDVTTVRGAPYVVAGNWAAQGDPAGPVINPSYLAPYAYRIFAGADTSHDWQALVGTSYRVLNESSTTPLSSGSAVGLPPNWCVLDRGSGRVRSFAGKADADAYGYDAFRVMWRVALDALWNRSDAATAYLASQSFLRSQWTAHGAVAPVYSHGGATQRGYDDPTVYGGDIAALLTDPRAAEAVLRQKLIASAHQSNGETFFGQADNYYEQNWVWFGIALAAGRLPNLAAVA
jgi:endo-1,4-beta-D-glucanase Y